MNYAYLSQMSVIFAIFCNVTVMSQLSLSSWFLHGEKIHISKHASIDNVMANREFFKHGILHFLGEKNKIKFLLLQNN